MHAVLYVVCWALCIRRTRTRVMLHVFLVMLHVFSVMLHVFPVMLHVFPVGLMLQETRATLQETRATLQETPATLHASASASAEYTKPSVVAIGIVINCIFCLMYSLHCIVGSTRSSSEEYRCKHL